MRAWVPVPGSAKARLIEAAVHGFEQHGFERCSVTELAAKAGVTTGSLYHHFGSKAGLYTLVRGDVGNRITDRMAGAAAASGQLGQARVRRSLLVAFDATVRFNACRLLGEPTPAADPTDPIATMLRSLLPPEQHAADTVLAAAWRAALLAVAEGTPAGRARDALAFALGADS
jgi:AcrR family transcriptional regulator